MKTGYFEKKSCTDRSAVEAKAHYWGFIVVNDRFTPIRLTEKQLAAAMTRAAKNMADCPVPPSKLEEWFLQIAKGRDIKR